MEIKKFKINEDAPTNSIGSGAIAGAGVPLAGKPANWGEPGISKKNQKKRTIMLRRKKPIMEIELFDLPKKTKMNYGTGKKLKHTYQLSTPDRIGRINKTHDLYHSIDGYHAVDKKTGKVDAAVFGHRAKVAKGYTFHVKNTDSTGKGPKAHEMYHAIMKHGHSNTIVSGESQSEGGKKVWQNLAKKKDVSMYGIHGKKILNLHPNHPDDEEDLYAQGKDYNYSEPLNKETLQAHQTKLVATLKPKNIREMDATSFRRSDNVEDKRQQDITQSPIKDFDHPEMRAKVSSSLVRQQSPIDTEHRQWLKYSDDPKLPSDNIINKDDSDSDLAQQAGIRSLKEDIKHGKFAGHDTFVVSADKFHAARNAKMKGKHWRTYIGEDDHGNAIREYANKNPKKSIILQCERTGAMCFARYSKE